MKDTGVIHQIKHIIEPDRLLLAWQPMEDSKDRTRRIVAELNRLQDGNVVLRYLVESEDFLRAQESGFSCFPAFRRTGRSYSEGVLDTFMLRLPHRERPDYAKFLNALRLPRNVEISDFALLGYSEARLPGDGFSIIHPFDGAPAPCEFLTEVAGYRHYRGTEADIPYGAELTFTPEPDNPYDPNAIRVELDADRVGYVNRGQTAAFHHWLKHNTVKAYIERKNGRVDRLRLLMFVEVF
jgi:hypothetical protein